MTDTCNGFNAAGEPCAIDFGIIDGKCHAHREGGRERLAAIASLGGQALAAKHAVQPLEEKDLRAIESPEDAKAALVDIRNFVATRRVTHAEGNAMSKAIEGWLKAEAAGITRTVVDDLTKKLEEKASEIADLKRQMATGRGRVTVS